MADRWAIYIDIEGFRALYDREITVLKSLGDLMAGIYSIGTRFYPESPNRLFAHQTGDGFVVVSEFGAASLETPIAIAIALLRHVAARGRFAKASIGEGNFADIQGCYPRAIMEACSEDHVVRLGDGLMTIFPVMGTALIDAVGIQKRSPKGALLTVASDNRSRLPSGCITKDMDGQEIIVIDWVHSALSLLEEIQNTAELSRPTAEQIRAVWGQYCSQQQPPSEWIASTEYYLGLADHS